jgi:hypothetical protein
VTDRRLSINPDLLGACADRSDVAGSPIRALLLLAAGSELLSESRTRGHEKK